jgi:hypothetical protein
MSGDEQLAANLIGAVAKERGGWDKQVEVVLAFMAEIRRLRAPADPVARMQAHRIADTVPSRRPDVDALTYGGAPRNGPVGKAIPLAPGDPTHIPAPVEALLKPLEDILFSLKREDLGRGSYLAKPLSAAIEAIRAALSGDPLGRLREWYASGQSYRRADVRHQDARWLVYLEDYDELGEGEPWVVVAEGTGPDLLAAIEDALVKAGAK